MRPPCDAYDRTTRLAAAGHGEPDALDPRDDDRDARPGRNRRLDRAARAGTASGAGNGNESSLFWTGSPTRSRAPEICLPASGVGVGAERAAQEDHMKRLCLPVPNRRLRLVVVSIRHRKEWLLCSLVVGWPNADTLPAFPVLLPSPANDRTLHQPPNLACGSARRRQPWRHLLRAMATGAHRTCPSE